MGLMAAVGSKDRSKDLPSARAISARRSSPAHSATAALASSSNRPMVMKPWIWRSKQT
jgi:hypothetical protein